MSKYQIRSLELGGVLDQAVAITKNHFGPLLTIVAITVAPFSLASNWITATMMPPPLSLQSTPQEQQVFWEAYFKTLWILMIVALPSIVAVAVCNAALVRAIADVYLGKTFSPLSAIRQAFQKLLPLVGTWILFFLAYVIGSMLCIIPGILVLLWYSLATQVVVIEGVAGTAALKRSKALMKDNMGAFFALLLVVGLVNLAIGAIANFVPQPHLRALMATLVQTVLSVFTSAAVVVFYFSARCKNEQFDLQLLADNMGEEIVLEVDDDQRSAE